mgnify:CR=1 FL=1
MSFQPVVPTSGLAGWRFLQATLQRQTEAFENSHEIKSNTAYFSEKIASVTSAEELVADRRLLSIALGAFIIANNFSASPVLSERCIENSSYFLCFRSGHLKLKHDQRTDLSQILRRHA